MKRLFEDVERKARALQVLLKKISLACKQRAYSSDVDDYISEAIDLATELSEAVSSTAAELENVRKRLRKRDERKLFGKLVCRVSWLAAVMDEVCELDGSTETIDVLRQRLAKRLSDLQVVLDVISQTWPD